MCQFPLAHDIFVRTEGRVLSGVVDMEMLLIPLSTVILQPSLGHRAYKSAGRMSARLKISCRDLSLLTSFVRSDVDGMVSHGACYRDWS